MHLCLARLMSCGCWGCTTCFFLNLTPSLVRADLLSLSHIKFTTVTKCNILAYSLFLCALSLAKPISIGWIWWGPLSIKMTPWLVLGLLLMAIRCDHSKYPHLVQLFVQVTLIGCCLLWSDVPGWVTNLLGVNLAVDLKAGCHRLL